MTTDPAAGLPSPDTGGMITTADQLRAYLDTHPTRHAPADGGQCACGWPHVPADLLKAWQENPAFPTQAEHAKAVLVGALGDLLPSDTSARNADGVMAPLPWRTLVRQLREEIDLRDRSVDPRLLALMRWCIGQGCADVETLAQVTVTNPRFMAQLLAGPVPAQDAEGAGGAEEGPGTGGFQPGSGEPAADAR